jgi:hypothetical protein
MKAPIDNEKEVEFREYTFRKSDSECSFTLVVSDKLKNSEIKKKFDNFYSELIQALNEIKRSETENPTPHLEKYVWYFKNDIDEYVPFASKEHVSLEIKYNEIMDARVQGKTYTNLIQLI